jgi:hypothetical protein
MWRVFPPEVVVGEFEGAWSSMTRDLSFAKYFETLEQAWTAFDSRSLNVTHRDFTSVRDGLQKLSDKRAARNRVNSGV